MSGEFRKALESGRIIVFDGAMGTELAARGVEPGTAANVDAPEIVLAVHRAYREAGADVLITNTFGVNRQVLGIRGDSGANTRHLLPDACMRGCELARESVGDGGFIAGDIGPTGDLLEPYGTMQEWKMRTIFLVTARLLAKGGVDLFLVETISDAREMTLAVEACRQAASEVARDIPVAASMAFDPSRQGGFRTNMGLSSSTPSDFEPSRKDAFPVNPGGPSQMADSAKVISAVRAMVAAGADIIGANCGSVTPAQMAEIVREFKRATDKPILIQPNAGVPELQAGKTVFRLAPEDFAEGMKQVLEAGAQLVGGCCGTTPEHVRLLRQEVDKFEARRRKMQS